MIKFILLVNKQGQTRLAQYYENKTTTEKEVLEGELVRRCLSRTEFQLAVDNDDVNELEILEFIHVLVETLDKYFDNVCELDIMFNLDKTHLILDEMVMNGCIVETNKTNVLSPLYLVEKVSMT